MTVPGVERNILRGLAEQVAEIAALPVHAEKADLWRRLNRLERVRPMVMLMNDTWNETGAPLEVETEHEFARQQESWLRRLLYDWTHIKDDRLYEAKVYSPLFLDDTGWGIQIDDTVPDHVFGARRYNCILADDADPEMLPMPTITIDHDRTERCYQLLCEIYDGILTVEKRGVDRPGFAIMDQFVRWRGVENALADLLDRPEWIHAWMERMTQCELARLDKLQDLGVLSLNSGCGTVGSGGCGLTDQLPQADFDGAHVRSIDQWGHATTQIFSEVSPAMHDEFALQYEKRFLSRFGLASYGCCEPLDAKLDIVKTIPNLRRVSMSPWVDVARGAEGLRDNYVFSHRPNPSIIAMDSWDPRYARNLLSDQLEKTRGCVIEVIMIAVHTCRGEPNRMSEWVDIAMQLAEEYA